MHPAKDARHRLKVFAWPQSVLRESLDYESPF
jgi:hypothetical protein